jgi:hypothetical protein
MDFKAFKDYLQEHKRLEIGNKLPEGVTPVALTTDGKSGIVILRGVGKFYFYCDYGTPCNVALERY